VSGNPRSQGKGSFGCCVRRFLDDKTANVNTPLSKIYYCITYNAIISNAIAYNAIVYNGITYSDITYSDITYSDITLMAHLQQNH
jgi:hypothetical protein